MSPLFFFLITFTAAANANERTFECHSCITSCRTSSDGRLDPQSCDCQSMGNGTDTCMGEKCFVKVEFFPEESTAIVQKGCAHGLPPGVDGCNFAGQLESTHCYCQGHLCNNREQLSDYTPQELPTVECCDCSQPGGDRCDDQGDGCSRTCRGNYCLVDFDGVEQGCGMGVPRLQSFLRIPNYIESLKQGEMTCARYQATQSTSVHGCVCTASHSNNISLSDTEWNSHTQSRLTSPSSSTESVLNSSLSSQSPPSTCNQLNQSRQYQLDSVIGRREDEQVYCYSLHQRSEEDQPFNKDIFKRSETCEGHYCFVSFTTIELLVESHNISSSNNNTMIEEYIGVAKPKFEILAGCLKVDDDKKVTPGCTTEYTHHQSSSTTDSYPISRHCICDSHLCNYWNMIQFNVSSGAGEGGTGTESPPPKSSPILNDDDNVSPTASGASGISTSIILLNQLQSIGLILIGVILLRGM